MLWWCRLSKTMLFLSQISVSVVCISNSSLSHSLIRTICLSCSNLYIPPVYTHSSSCCSLFLYHVSSWQDLAQFEAAQMLSYEFATQKTGQGYRDEMHRARCACHTQDLPDSVAATACKVVNESNNSSQPLLGSKETRQSLLPKL